jgi:hypothetical protein
MIWEFFVNLRSKRVNDRKLVRSLVDPTRVSIIVLVFDKQEPPTRIFVTTPPKKDPSPQRTERRLPTFTLSCKSESSFRLSRLVVSSVSWSSTAEGLRADRIMERLLPRARSEPWASILSFSSASLEPWVLRDDLFVGIINQEQDAKMRVFNQRKANGACQSSLSGPDPLH